MTTDFQIAALFGDRKTNAEVTATTVNGGQASDEWDWGAILANGIRGAAYGAMQASVRGAYASGQLAPAPAARGEGGGLFTLLILGGLVYFAVAD